MRKLALILTLLFNPSFVFATDYIEIGIEGTATVKVFDKGDWKGEKLLDEEGKQVYTMEQAMEIMEARGYELVGIFTVTYVNALPSTRFLLKKVEGKMIDANPIYEESYVQSRAMYPMEKSGGSGSSLELAGWRWDYVPSPDDISKENGRIVFEIKIDDNGKVIGVRTLEKTVSPAIEQLYRREVERLSFSPTSDNTTPAPISTGKITFSIRNK